MKSFFAWVLWWNSNIGENRAPEFFGKGKGLEYLKACAAMQTGIPHEELRNLYKIDFSKPKALNTCIVFSQNDIILNGCESKNSYTKLSPDKLIALERGGHCGFKVIEDLSTSSRHVQ